MMRIPFNIPCVWGDEQKYLEKVISNRKFSGRGEFCKKCATLIGKITLAKKVFMTSSCTAALEMCAIILHLQPGDEIIMPSFTYIASSNPFVRNGAKIVWCDIRKDMKNIDNNQLEKLITKKTKAVVIVHYGGFSCEMDEITAICKKHNILLIEDAAMALGTKYKDKPLGSFGDFAVISFHETKNIQCGEGGALLVNNPDMIEEATYLYDKGTNRGEFEKGESDNYTWISSSSNFLMSELQAAFLYTQLLHLTEITHERLNNWNLYYELLSRFLPSDSLAPTSSHIQSNAHIFYIMLSNSNERKLLIQYLEKRGIQTVFHYIPLHSAPFWQGKYSETQLPVTDKVSQTILRLPLFFGFIPDYITEIVHHVRQFLT
ncbi:MAG: dTDP-4-amino-4,6-dideoxygalactose transaminase [Candidatus Cloacimonetes bacterium]|nr:dTDP-4-amino-4,6-dideoxygalactose transaminase [Candidatus Cloacimonadota bacterium]